MTKYCSRVSVFAVGVVALAGLTACSEDPAAVSDEVVLLSVVPAGGSVGVDIGTSVVVTFDHAVMPSMVDYAALHEGGVDGPGVNGTWQLSNDGIVLTFTPALPLKAATSYTIHLGGGMEGDHGEPMNFEMHGSAHMGGQWATGGMMGGGMGGANPHMGNGWSHANGSYGMIFSFTTVA
jgi:hypothetical protein